jgi:hypothetical protein
VYNGGSWHTTTPLHAAAVVGVDGVGPAGPSRLAAVRG